MLFFAASFFLCPLYLSLFNIRLNLSPQTFFWLFLLFLLFSRLVVVSPGSFDPKKLSLLLLLKTTEYVYLNQLGGKYQYGIWKYCVAIRVQRAIQCGNTLMNDAFGGSNVLP